MNRSLTTIWRTSIWILAVVLAASFGAAAQRIEIVHMRDPGHAGEWGEWVEAAARAFEALHPDVKVTILVSASRGEQQDKIVAMHATNTLPDVIEVFPAGHYQFTQHGIFQYLDPFMEKEQDFGWDQFFPTADLAAQIAEDQEAVGAHWFLPISMWTTAYRFNEDLFEMAGLTVPSRLDHHWTFEEAVAIDQKLTRINDEGIIEQFGVDIRSDHRSIVWFHNAGAWPVDRYVHPTESRLLDPGVRETLELLNTVWSYRLNLPQEPGAPWAARLAGPDFTRNYLLAGESFAYSFGPNPKKVRGGSENVTVGVAMGAQTQHPEIAWEWMKFLATEQARSRIEMTGRPVPWAPAAREYQTLLLDASEWEYMWIEIMASPDSYERPVWSSDVQAILTGLIRTVARGEQAIGPALESAHAQMQAILAAGR
jgi:ABC-type glycerol-3-phosphate transport system substrate-binding protein